MCLYECFGIHKHRDDSWDAPLPAPATKTPHGRSPPQPQPRSLYAPPQFTYNVNGVHQTAAAAGAEAAHKAANDVRKFPAAAPAGALRQQPAWVAGEAAGHGAQQHHYNYYEREPVHKEDTMDCHYSTATATADHERY